MRRLALGLLLVVLAGCRYRTRFDLPAHLQTFHVAIFTNKTLERNVDFEFTQELMSEIRARTPLRQVPEDQADLLITGEIARLDRYTLRRKSRGLKSEMRYVLFVNVQMTDRKKDLVFFDGKDLNWRAEFRMNLGETPVQAREEVIRELARHVVSRAFERWPTPPTETPPGAEPGTEQAPAASR